MHAQKEVWTASLLLFHRWTDELPLGVPHARPKARPRLPSQRETHKLLHLIPPQTPPPNIIPVLLHPQLSICLSLSLLPVPIQVIHHPLFYFPAARAHLEASDTPQVDFDILEMAAMAAMATVNAAASMMQTANLATTTKVSATSTVRMGALRLPAISTRRASVMVRAAGNPDRIDNFVEGAKSDASENAANFGNAVAESAGEVERTIKDVGRDMGGKAQEAVDAANKKADEAGGKANEVGDEVKTSTQNTLDAATETRSGQSTVDKAQNAVGNVGDNLKQNFDYGTGAVQNAADDASKDVKKTSDRL